VDDTRDRIVRKGDYIYGSFFKPEAVDGYINGVNPGDRGDVLGRFPFSASSADEAVEYARIGARTWRRTPLSDRAVAVRRFRDHLHRFHERLARLITRETGKPLWESRQEVVATIRAIDLFLEDGVALLQPRVMEEIGARSDPVPRGVVVMLSPCTFPLQITAQQSALALLSGNSVVVKPSKFTPGVGQAIAELWDRCKLPRGVYNMVHGPGTVVGQRLALNPAVEALVFTGSYTTLQQLRGALADRPELPLVSQCGGKGTAIVLDDAELDRAVYEVMVSAFLTSGQRHNSTGRVIVTDGIFDAFLNELVDKSSRIEVGYGFRGDVFMGPLISDNLRNRYKRYGKKLVSMGHQALIEADSIESADPKGYYARPAIYRVHWDNGHPFLGEPPPGPLLTVYRVSSWQEAAALHNQCMYRLATSVFTRPDNPALVELRDRLRTGALNLNRGTIGASLRLPSQGLGRSGNGMPGGLELLHALTAPRSMLIETRPFQGQAVLPGTHWHAPTQMEPEVHVEDAEDELLLDEETHD
jgi:succinylglutamic semialdehyde dehydrogenase